MIDCINCHFDWTAFWTFVTAMATIAIAFIANIELSKTRNIESAKFIQDFKNDFFTAQTRELLMLFEYNQIQFIEGNDKEHNLEGLPKNLCYFKVTINQYERKGEIPAYFLNHKN